MLIKKIMGICLRGGDCVVFWVLLAPDYIGIFTDFTRLISHYEKLKNYLYPVDDVINAYKKVQSYVNFPERYKLGVEDLDKFPFNRFISRKGESVE